ncbi:hypothetical protein V5P93_001419 [Actinokineospora auranticolor]|uniref:Uncharacterized protein n=1 Tax=Actinokineospora auranticolor TaxID=155976 RepID=A0A2S6GV21_9PSEU|nr:hypothetical protein [Actinokineospora auranticolor]PPK69043.1 hypothetical protein CLV40_104293 [Actinokineospora auranticolor]
MHPDVYQDMIRHQQAEARQEAAAWRFGHGEPAAELAWEEPPAHPKDTIWQRIVAGSRNPLRT